MGGGCLSALCHCGQLKRGPRTDAAVFAVIPLSNGRKVKGEGRERRDEVKAGGG